MRDDLSSLRRRALREVAPALFVVLAAVAVVSLLVAAGAAGSALSSKNGKLAFVAGSPSIDGTGSPSIWVMSANGSGRKVLTPHNYFASVARADSEPDWSPKGTAIAFTRSRQTTGYGPDAQVEPTTDIDVMNADGSSQTRLTRTTMNDHSPAWSPDGKKIAFVRDRVIRRGRGGGRAIPYTGEIYVMRANGSGQTRLTRVALAACGSTNIYASQPAWSPDGKKIAFTMLASDYPCNNEIYVMNVDGSGQRQLTGNGDQGAANASYPAWSPDGKKIAFQSETPNALADGKVEIYVMNADGSGLTRLTKNDGFCP